MSLFRIGQLFLSTSGISFFLWAFVDPRFRDGEGFLRAGFCLPISVGVALMIFAWTMTGCWRRFGLWLALALVGQAAALQMIEAGPLIHYQHYKPFSRLLADTHPLLLAYLVLQTALVVTGLRNRWPAIRGWIGRSLRPWQLLGISVILFLSSAPVSREISVYVAELLFAAFVQGVSLGNIVLVLFSIPEGALCGVSETLRRVFEFSGKAPALSVSKEDTRELGGIDRFAVLSAAWVTALAIILAVLSYERHPHIQDEVVYLTQARVLASGQLTMPAPPVPDAFDVYLMEVEGERWYASPPPGWPAILALGVLLGLPWLVNPVLAGVNVLLSLFLIREIYDPRTARIAVLLLCISPWYLFMAMNFLPHTSTVTCALVAAAAMIQARRRGKAAWGWVSGIATGMASLIRPLEGLVLAALLGLWAIGVGGRRLKVSAIAGFALGCILVGAVVLPYNKLLTGDPTVFPIMAYTDKHYGSNSNAFGFGSDRGMGWALDPYPGHGPLDALVNANLNISSLSFELFGWGTGSLIILLLFIFAGRLQRSDYLMLAVIVAVFGVHIFYWYSGGPDFGARYWYLMLVPCVALTARGVQSLGKPTDDGLPGYNHNATRLMVALLSLSLLTLVNFFPWRAIDKYHHYRRMRPDIPYLAKKHAFGKSLVLIRGDQHSDYASAWVYNPLDLHADVPVYAWDRSQDVRTSIVTAYADRPVWLIDGPSITGRGYEVVAGPLSGKKLLAGRL